MSGGDPSRATMVVTLDGLSGSGKSTLARELARRLGWTWLDSGAWYRALTWAVLRAGADPAVEDQVLDVLFRTHLDAESDGRVRVDGRFPGDALRTPEIDRAVAVLADHPRVRAELVRRMREFAAHAAAAGAGLVADGRDAGAVIFPDADLKVFVDAPLAVRARRRLAQRGGPVEDPAAEAAMERELATRDARDLARGEAAPRPRSGTFVLENTDGIEEAIGSLLSRIQRLRAVREAPGSGAGPSPD